MINHKLIIILTTISFQVYADGKCHGRFINPISHVAWSTMFPIYVAGVKVAKSNNDATTPPATRTPLCKCGAPIPRIGIPIGFWQPFRAIDVTRKPYCMVNLGGTKINLGIKTPTGDISNNVASDKGTGHQQAFYHVHWYIYPLLIWMNLLTDLMCLEHEDFDIAYLTELDPMWADDELGLWLNPEAVLFSNPIVQATCTADCAATTAGRAINSLFWCSGCRGGVYPLTGTVPFYQSGVDASTLIAERMIFKLHRELLLHGSMGKRGMCGKYPMPWWKKDQYKLQPVYPSIDKSKEYRSNVIGKSSFIWGTGKDINPYDGDFGYLLWRRKECCVL